MNTALTTLTPSPELKSLWSMTGDTPPPFMSAEEIEERLAKHWHQHRPEITVLSKSMNLPTGIGGDAVAGMVVAAVFLALACAGLLWITKASGMFALIILATVLGGGLGVIAKILAEDQAEKRSRLAGKLFQRQLREVSTERLEQLFEARGGIKSRYCIKQELEKRCPTPSMQELMKESEQNQAQRGMTL